MTRKIKSLTVSSLIIALTIALSGCSMTTLKQRESLLSQQQEELKEQRQKLENNQQQLQQEQTRLKTLKIALDQEQKRLNILKKSPESRNSANIINKTSLIRIGAREHAYLSPPGIHLIARIDTGAKTSSLNALNLTEFERDGKPYVRFNIVDPDNNKKIEIIRRVQGHIKIKEHQGDAQSRPVVKMRIRIGSIDQRIEMTLADRSEFKNQLLIGRNFLRDFAVVDVSKRFLSKTTPTEAD